MDSLLKALVWLGWSAYLSAKPIEAFFIYARVFSDQDLQVRILERLIPYFKSADYILLGAIILSLVSFLHGRSRARSRRFRSDCHAEHEQGESASAPLSLPLSRAISVAMLIFLTAVYSITFWLEPSPSLFIVFAVIWGVVLAQRLVRRQDKA